MSTKKLVITHQSIFSLLTDKNFKLDYKSLFNRKDLSFYTTKHIEKIITEMMKHKEIEYTDEMKAILTEILKNIDMISAENQSTDFRDDSIINLYSELLTTIEGGYIWDDDYNQLLGSSKIFISTDDLLEFLKPRVQKFVPERMFVFGIDVSKVNIMTKDEWFQQTPAKQFKHGYRLSASNFTNPNIIFSFDFYDDWQIYPEHVPAQNFSMNRKSNRNINDPFYEIILTIKNLENKDMNFYTFVDKNHSSKETFDYSIKPIIIEDDDRTFLIWKIDKIRANETFQITYKLKPSR